MRSHFHTWLRSVHYVISTILAWLQRCKKYWDLWTGWMRSKQRNTFLKTKHLGNSIKSMMKLHILHNIGNIRSVTCRPSTCSVKYDTYTLAQMTQDCTLCYLTNIGLASKPCPKMINFLLLYTHRQTEICVWLFM